ncbi:MAG: 30S ribosomal protein S20 [Chloroflexi bacterium]|nr:30S ribosomal protein S20 [Chloroflexota bacterium]
MPNTKSAAKALRVSVRRQKQNRPIRTATRTSVTKAIKAVQEQPQEEARSAIRSAERILDKAAHKKIIHPNKAARLKSRLMKRLNAQTAATGKAPAKTTPARKAPARKAPARKTPARKTTRKP